MLTRVTEARANAVAAPSAAGSAPRRSEPARPAGLSGLGAGSLRAIVHAQATNSLDPPCRAPDFLHEPQEQLQALAVLAQGALGQLEAGGDDALHLAVDGPGHHAALAAGAAFGALLVWVEPSDGARSVSLVYACEALGLTAKDKDSEEE